MIVRAKVSAASGDHYRVMVGERISGLLPIMRVGDQLEPIIFQPGDWVVAAFFGSLADGIILGRG